MQATKLRGFTLVEVLVALFVMAIVALMAWQGIDGILRTREISAGQVDRTLRLQSVIAQWEQDLAAVQDTLIVPALSFDGASLRMTREADSGMQVVAWSLRGTDWVRWAGPPVTGAGSLREQWLQSLQLLGNEGGHLLALSGLADWQVYFFRDNGWSNAQSTGNIVPAAPAAPASGVPVARTRVALPSGVRVLLTMGPESGFSGSLTRDVRLVAQ